jgi:hypothetical protein
MNVGTVTEPPAVAVGDGGARQRWAMARVAALAAALAAAALLTAACGGGSASTAGSSGTGQGGLAQALAFAHCMRSHGAPNYPDPNSSGVFMVNPSNSSRFDAPQSTRAACHHLLPRRGKPLTPAQQAQQQRQVLAFAACMRRHGFPKFPDDEGGSDGIHIGHLLSLGIDVNSPQFSAALKTCGF